MNLVDSGNLALLRPCTSMANRSNERRQNRSPPFAYPQLQRPISSPFSSGFRLQTLLHACCDAQKAIDFAHVCCNFFAYFLLILLGFWMLDFKLKFSTFRMFMNIIAMIGVRSLPDLPAFSSVRTFWSSDLKLENFLRKISISTRNFLVTIAGWLVDYHLSGSNEVVQCDL